MNCFVEIYYQISKQICIEESCDYEYEMELFNQIEKRHRQYNICIYCNKNIGIIFLKILHLILSFVWIVETKLLSHKFVDSTGYLLLFDQKTLPRRYFRNRNAFR